MDNGQALLQKIRQEKNPDEYRHDHWEGSFTQYLDIIRAVTCFIC